MAPTNAPPGSTRFEEARRRLAKMTAREVEAITDDEVRVFLEIVGREPRPTIG